MHEINFSTFQQEPPHPEDENIVFTFNFSNVPERPRIRRRIRSSNWSPKIREVREVGWEWMLRRNDGPVPESPQNMDVWNTASRQWMTPRRFLNDPLPPNEPMPAWLRVGQDITIPSGSDLIKPGRIEIPIAQLPFEASAILARHVMRVIRPRAYRNYIVHEIFELGLMSGDIDAPLISLWSPGADAAVGRPVVFSGLVVERSSDEERSGLSSGQLKITDVGASTPRYFDFARQNWASEPEGTGKTIELTLSNPSAARFSTDWRNQAGGSGQYQAIIEVADFRGNVGRLERSFYIDDEAPVISFQGAEHRAVTGPIAWVEGSVRDDFEIEDLTITVADNETGRFWDQSSADWVQNEVRNQLSLSPSASTQLFFYEWVPAGSSGYFSVVVRAQDDAGNKSHRLRRVRYARVDETAPLVEITSPQDGGTIAAGNILIRGRALDNVELASVQVFVQRDGSNQAPTEIPTNLGSAATSWKPWEAVLDTSAFGGSGLYRIWALATDTAGLERHDMMELNVV